VAVGERVGCTEPGERGGDCGRWALASPSSHGAKGGATAIHAASCMATSKRCIASALALDERPQESGAEMDDGEEVADRGARLGWWPVAGGGVHVPANRRTVESMAARSR